ncbi:MAG: thioesterase II family protein [Candidatus Promineifilaceae bacterium]
MILDSIPPSKWVLRPKPNPKARLRLICFPNSGSGPVIFYKWPSYLPPEVELWGIRLPGRETRISEPAYTQLPELVERTAEVLQPYLDRPYALFGHSLGALTSYELAHHFQKLGLSQPVHLLLSGHRAPHRPPLNPPYHQTEDKVFLEHLRQFNGTPDAILQNEELIKLMLPGLRADFTVWETYTYNNHPPLDCPMSIFGSFGDPEATAFDFEAWREHTSGPFTLRMFDGGHFYFQNDLASFLQIISETLQPHLL